MPLENTQAQAQFDELQERLRDPNFAGMVLSGTGDFIPISTLCAIETPEELMQVLYPETN